MTAPEHLRILVTGSREWADVAAFHRVIGRWLDLQGRWDRPGNRPIGPLTVVHGDARGLDTIARQWAEFYGPRLGITHEPHAVPDAEWRASRGAGHARNHEMVALGARICFGFPLPGSRGTPRCMEDAERSSIEVLNGPDFLHQTDPDSIASAP